MEGVGVKPLSRWMKVSTPLAASTSSAVRCAGADSGVRILAHEERPVDALPFAVFADRLRDRENVRLGERATERRAAMSARAEADELIGVVYIRTTIAILVL